MEDDKLVEYLKDKGLVATKKALYTYEATESRVNFSVLSHVIFSHFLIESQRSPIKRG